MEDQRSINVDQRNGNFHIKVKGEFSPNTAAVLATIISKKYTGHGNIFIHTAGITEVKMGAQFALASLIELSELPADNIYFTGAKGLQLGHDSAKVIIHRKKEEGHGGCGGNCKKCKSLARKAA